MSGWCISTHNMHRVNCFDAAERVWNDANPWKNELTSWRPLAERRATHKRIVRINDGDAYQLVLYSTPLVTYHRNGDIELRTYDSVSTRMFAWVVRPQGLSIESANSKMYWGFPSQEGDRYIREGPGPLKLEYVGTGRYILATKPAEDYEWVLDRKAAAAVRKKLSHYDKWARLTMRLQGDKSYAWYRNPSKTNIAALLVEPERVDLFPKYLDDLGPPDNFFREAYEVAGARTQVPVPYDRLPKRQK